jgi:hypothetical protein
MLDIMHMDAFDKACVLVKGLLICANFKLEETYTSLLAIILKVESFSNVKQSEKIMLKKNKFKTKNDIMKRHGTKGIKPANTTGLNIFKLHKKENAFSFLKMFSQRINPKGNLGCGSNWWSAMHLLLCIL